MNNIENYKPSDEETKKAESLMTDEQIEQSEDREFQAAAAKVRERMQEAAREAAKKKIGEATGRHEGFQVNPGDPDAALNARLDTRQNS